uniref:LITAF domain-containing protein n=1 Tax=Plectus sambesii TaxID=2011161 RepID=A0A914W4S0_9BILA
MCDGNKAVTCTEYSHPVSVSGKLHGDRYIYKENSDLVSFHFAIINHTVERQWASLSALLPKQSGMTDLRMKINYTLEGSDAHQSSKVDDVQEFDLGYVRSDAKETGPEACRKVDCNYPQTERLNSERCLNGGRCHNWEDESPYESTQAFFYCTCNRTDSYEYYGPFCEELRYVDNAKTHSPQWDAAATGASQRTLVITGNIFADKVMEEIKSASSPNIPPPPYYADNIAPQTVFYGPRETVEVAVLPHEASVQPHLHTVLHMNPTAYGRLPLPVKCPHCKENVTTTIKYEIGTLTWLAFALLFLLGFILLIPWCLCWIPFCAKGTRTAAHICPKCNQKLATVAAG